MNKLFNLLISTNLNNRCLFFYENHFTFYHLYICGNFFIIAVFSTNTSINSTNYFPQTSGANLHSLRESTSSATIYSELRACSIIEL